MDQKLPKSGPDDRAGFREWFLRCFGDFSHTLVAMDSTDQRHMHDLKYTAYASWQEAKRRVEAKKELAKRKLAALEDENARLRDALQELYDWQNRPPLWSQKWLVGWGGAMYKARALLHKPEGGEREG